MNEVKTNDEDRSAFIDLTTMIAAGDLEGAQSQVIEAATDQGVGFTKSFLEQYFPTVEVSFETKEGTKPTTGILVVAPLSDSEDIENTLFTQVSAFYTDNRTTLNAGLGYRRLVSDNTLMLGVNAFYDHEFPYDHGRYSVGLEARSTVGEINANMYQAMTKWKTGKNGQEERALDGWDIEAGLPLPYMNWATVFVKRYQDYFSWKLKYLIVFSFSNMVDYLRDMSFLFYSKTRKALKKSSGCSIHDDWPYNRCVYQYKHS